MIELKKVSRITTLPKRFLDVNSLISFESKDGRTLHAIGGRSWIITVDTESDKILERISLNEHGYTDNWGLYVLCNVPFLRCMVSEIERSLFLVHYDDGYMVEKDVIRGLETSGEENIVCVVDEKRIAFVKDSDKNLYFFDLSTREITHELKIREGVVQSFGNTADLIVNPETHPGVMYVVLSESVSIAGVQKMKYLLTLIDTNECTIIKKSEYVMEDGVDFNFLISSSVHFYGLVVKIPTVLNYMPRIGGSRETNDLSTTVHPIPRSFKEHGSSIKMDPNTCGNEKVLDKGKFEPFYHCSHSPDSHSFLGRILNESKFQFASYHTDTKKWELFFDGHGKEVQFGFQRNDFRCNVRNRGRDVSFAYYGRKEENEKVIEIVQYVNRYVKLDLDEDECERVVYLMENPLEDVKVLKISLSFSELSAMKTLLV